MLTDADHARINKITDEILDMALRAGDRRLASRLTIATQWLEMSADLLDHQLAALPIAVCAAPGLLLLPPPEDSAQSN